MLITCTKVLKGLAFGKIVTSTVIYSSAASQFFCFRCIQTELLMHVDALRCYNQASLSQNKHNQKQDIVFRAPHMYLKTRSKQTITFVHICLHYLFLRLSSES